MTPNRAISLGLVLAFGATVLPTSGCIFLVGGSASTGACEFAGSGSPCGQCASRACQSEINACCLDSSCEPGLSYLDDCASGDANACVVLLGGGGIIDPALGKVGSCLASRCAACGGVDGGGAEGGADAPGPPQDGGPFKFCTLLSDNACDCTLSTGQPITSPSCGPKTVKNPLCCASHDWPTGSQSTCSCETYDCYLETQFCECSGDSSADQDGQPYTCTEPSLICCVNDGSCVCTPNACGPGEQQVTNCSPAVAGCDSSQVQVDSCL